MNEKKNRPITGGMAVIECLKAYNIKYVFGLIGSATMEIFDALYDEKDITSLNDIIFEPSKEQILQLLIPKHLNTQIWKYLLESFASEQGARMVAMENATENAGDMISDLTLEFNKARQTAITTEMLEIVGGAEALSN